MGVDGAPLVELTRDEMIFAAMGAVVRNIDALLAGRVSYYGDPYRDLWANNVTGTFGECAANKHLGRYWTPCYAEPTGVPDAGRRTQVRATTDLEGGLRGYKRDEPEHAFILVLARAPKFWLRGWLWGHELKAGAFKGEQAWCAPQAVLRPLPSRALVTAR